MFSTLTSERLPDVTQRRRSWWRWAAAAVVIAGAVALLFAFAAGSESPTHAYELNGSLEDEYGGPPLVELGGTLGAEGYSFVSRGGLQLDVDLGESYTIETRVRTNTAGSSNGWVKLFDFKDGVSDGGIYIFGGYQLAFGPKEPCPSEERGNLLQGCPPLGRRWLLYGPEDALNVGSFATIRFVRDGETDTVEAFVDGERQMWSPVGPFHAYDWWLGDEPQPTDAELEALGRTDRVHDYNGETIQSSKRVLSIMADDDPTGGFESTSGEIDYIHITIP